jgi:hypothetical protein
MIELATLNPQVFANSKIPSHSFFRRHIMLRNSECSTQLNNRLQQQRRSSKHSTNDLYSGRDLGGRTGEARRVCACSAGTSWVCRCWGDDDDAGAGEVIWRWRWASGGRLIQGGRLRDRVGADGEGALRCGHRRLGGSGGLGRALRRRGSTAARLAWVRSFGTVEGGGRGWGSAATRLARIAGFGAVKGGRAGRGCGCSTTARLAGIAGLGTVESGRAGCGRWRGTAARLAWIRSACTIEGSGRGGGATARLARI